MSCFVYYKDIKMMIYLLTLNPYYITCPEVELNHGYCDIRHSYIIELKGKEKNETATI